VLEWDNVSLSNSGQGTFCEPRVAAMIAREEHLNVNAVGLHSAGSSILPHRRVTDEDRQMLEEIAKLPEALPNSKL
jgi:glycerol-3-phosphate dehydrogenase